MKQGNAIEVHHITKSFKVYLDKGRTLKEKILFRNRRRYEERKVLDDISFSVKEGEAIGLIGQNGCGKSTTLKLLTRIMYPDIGTIEMKGRVSSLIELGAGFHPDMSGRENIYINAAIFGLTKGEIDKRLDDIIEFSELESYIDNPVRTYSSGMYMRLAFAVAINVDADILLVDEILAVGDANFQVKCFNRLKEIKAAGTTIVIVSHALGQIEKICDKAYWIKDGHIEQSGAPVDVDRMYMEYMSSGDISLSGKEEKSKEKDKEQDKKEEHDANRFGNRVAEFDSIRCVDQNGNDKDKYKLGEGIRFLLNYTSKKPNMRLNFGISIFGIDEMSRFGTNTWIDTKKFYPGSARGTVELEINSCMLLPGRYRIDFAIENDSGELLDYYKEAISLNINSNCEAVGMMYMKHSWILNDKTIFDEH